MSKFTPGPWEWDVAPSGEVRLATPDRGRLYVMGFERKGMQGAQPRFSDWGKGPRERRGGIMLGFADAGGANHPDARLIAAAPDLLEALKQWAHAVAIGDEVELINASAARDAAIVKATGEEK